MTLWTYISKAFLNRWNLLLFGGACGFSLLSGGPEVMLPIVAAGELLYLGLLGTHPKFQAYVNAQEAKSTRTDKSRDTQQALNTILRALPPKSLERYEALRDRCNDLRQLALQIKGAGSSDSPLLFEQSQLASLDRLLWIYLRLLYTYHSLEQFLRKTDVERIRQDIENLENRLKKTEAMKDELQREKFTRTLRDNLDTCRHRLDNYEKARANHEFMQLEIDRLENKIRSLSERAINRQEPDYITGQVDEVAASMIQTEQTMNELQFATGLATTDEEVPALLREKQTA